MSFWIEHDAEGRIYQLTEGVEAPQPFFGGTVIEVESRLNTGTAMVLDGELVEFGPPPGERFVKDAATRTWAALPPPEQSDAEKIAAVQVRLQRVMDDAARALGYDDIKTAITYAEEPAVPKFQAEGLAFRTWRSLVWAACYAHPAMQGLAPFPTPDEAEALMPALVLPETTP